MSGSLSRKKGTGQDVRSHFGFLMIVQRLPEHMPFPEIPSLRKPWNADEGSGAKCIFDAIL